MRFWQIHFPEGYDKRTDNHIGIEWGKTILNDCLYLGMKNDVNEDIIPTGVDLPFSSPVKKGFKIPPGQDAISFPIKSRNIDGSFRTIAKGTIGFSNNISRVIFLYNNSYFLYINVLVNLKKSRAIDYN